MFFSLKCGVLFDPLLDEVETQQDIQRLLILSQAIDNANKEEVKEPIISAILKKYGEDNELSLRKVREALEERVQGKTKFLKALSNDKETETNKKIFRVFRYISGY